MVSLFCTSLILLIVSCLVVVSNLFTSISGNPFQVLRKKSVEHYLRRILTNKCHIFEYLFRFEMNHRRQIFIVRLTEVTFKT